MTRPDRAAVIAATPSTLAAVICGTAAVICASALLWLFTVIAIAYTAIVLAVFWRVPHESDLMAIADATREPRFDLWERELSQP